MDRRAGFLGGFGSGTNDNRNAPDHVDRRSSFARNRGNIPHRIGFGLRRITVESDRPWTPVTKLGRLVKDGRVTSIEEIFRRSIPILEYQIVDHLIPNLKEEVLKILPVQKQVANGIQTRFRAFVAVGDKNGHVGLGVQCAKRVSTAIRRAIYRAKTSVIPVRRGYWRTKSGQPHTVPFKVAVRFCTAQVTLHPAPRGAGLNAPIIMQKLLFLGGIKDCYSSVISNLTVGPVVKATFFALQCSFWCGSEDAEEKDNAFPELQSTFNH